jgi:tRNA(fMet)-specific endonuclease VapC
VLILDTDHLSEFDAASDAGARLKKRLIAADEEVAATIISVEEQFRGWTAQIHKLHADPNAQIPIYARLKGRLEFYAAWNVLSWDEDSARNFVNFRRQGVRVGSMDLKIACIAITHDATVLTRNARDFAQVPGLRTENWLD